MQKRSSKRCMCATAEATSMAFDAAAGIVSRPSGPKYKPAGGKPGHLQRGHDRVTRICLEDVLATVTIHARIKAQDLVYKSKFLWVSLNAHNSECDVKE